jgi:hypothetical protein
MLPTPDLPQCAAEVAFEVDMEALAIMSKPTVPQLVTNAVAPITTLAIARLKL